jgi:hypothetical protein
LKQEKAAPPLLENEEIKKLGKKRIAMERTKATTPPNLLGIDRRIA